MQYTIVFVIITPLGHVLIKIITRLSRGGMLLAFYNVNYETRETKISRGYRGTSLSRKVVIYGIT